MPAWDQIGAKSNALWILSGMIVGEQQTERPPVRLSLRNPIMCFDQAARAAAFFRFLRQPVVSRALTFFATYHSD